MAKPLLSLASWIAKYLPVPVFRDIYRIPWIAKPLRRILNRAAPKGYTEVTIAAGPAAGCQMYLNLQSEKDYWLGTYEIDLSKALVEWGKPGMVAYDLGANIGYISLIMAITVGAGGQVFAFEALPENLERLKHNIAINNLGDRVKTVPKAVSDQNEELTFLVGPSGGTGKAVGSAGRIDLVYSEQIKVPGTTLDTFIFEEGHPAPDLIKLDIEGGEVLALPKMQGTLSQSKPIVLMELHGPEAIDVAWDIFRDHHYRICRMANGYPIINSKDEIDWKAYIIALPEQE
jgi:FkbM family methyltransferase